MTEQAEVKARELAKMLAAKISQQYGDNIYVLLYNAYLEGWNDSVKVHEKKVE